MTKKVTGNVRLRLVKPFNVKTDKMFAEVFASISSHPGQYYTYTLGIQNGNYSYKECQCMSYSELACHLFSIRKTW